MNKLIGAIMMSVLFAAFVAFSNDSTNEKLDGKTVYICDYFPKIMGAATVSFAIVGKDSIAEILTYKISYSKNRILNVKFHSDDTKYRIKQLDDGSVLVKQLNGIFYSSRLFESGKKMSDSFYNLISPNFIKIENDSKLLLISKLHNPKAKE